MKKLITILGTIIFLGIGTGTANGLKIGDKMPDFSVMNQIGEERMWSGNGKAGKWVYYDKDDDGIWDYQVVYQACNFGTIGLPFGFYERVTDLIFFDKEGNGIIEEKSKYTMGRRIPDDVPDCSIKTEKVKF